MSREVTPDYSEATNPLLYTRSAERTTRLVKTLFGLSIIDAENVPMEGAGIIAFVHRSLGDPWFLGASVPRAFRAMAKKQLNERWFYFRLGQYMAERDVFFVDRDDTSVETYTTSVNTLRQDLLLAVAPEGTHHNKGSRVGPIKAGVARIALKAASEDIHCPIVPLAMTTEHLRLRRPIQAVFGNAIIPGKFDAGSERKKAGLALTEEVHSAMQETYDKALELAS